MATSTSRSPLYECGNHLRSNPTEPPSTNSWVPTICKEVNPGFAFSRRACQISEFPKKTVPRLFSRKSRDRSKACWLSQRGNPHEPSNCFLFFLRASSSGSLGRLPVRIPPKTTQPSPCLSHPKCLRIRRPGGSIERACCLLASWWVDMFFRNRRRDKTNRALLVCRSPFKSTS